MIPIKNKIYIDDCLDFLKKIDNECIDMCVTSPPYYLLRKYQSGDKEIGQEQTLQDYIKKLCDVFDEIRRVLKPSGSCWVNIGDTYKDKTLLQIPSRFEIEMCDRGWILRNEIIWCKPNPQPAPIKDRFLVNHEKFFFFTKSKRYYFNQPRIPQKEISIRRAFSKNNKNKRKDNNLNGKSGFSISSKNQDKTYEKLRKQILDGHIPTTPMRTVWNLPTKSLRGKKHFAVYPETLICHPINSCCPDDGIVIDPFMGSGTTAIVSKILGKNYIGIELNSDYQKIAEERIKQSLSDFKYCQKIKNLLKIDDTVCKKVINEINKDNGIDIQDLFE
jgi:DNA modification methylase